jgi:hypothetical protein
MGSIVWRGFAVLITAVSSGCAIGQSTAPASTLRAFESEAALETHVKKMAADVQRRREEDERKRAQAARERAAKGLPPLDQAQPKFSAPPAPAAKAASAAPGAAAESVTNVQHASVDEGGIVKVHGDHLVVLRRGRLFTVRIAGSDLAPAGAAHAYGQDVNPRGASPTAGRWARNPRAAPTMAASHRAWIGTATRGRSSCAGASLRCLATRSWRDA